MKRRLRVRPEAENDLAGAYAWYEECCPGLGSRFFDEFTRAVTALEYDPLAFTEVLPGIRRYVLHTFPYSAFYSVSDD
jgi:hypothetical protein